ncbi:unnamed protein product [Tuber aestivum]|uniref:Uncharacterized protein n=1 Tax=Tuber aestivum TaxID=59557 RepID=A0A292PZC4_9PEZI|nr:unnamed protein product [Tuber aestivum]
MLVHKPLVSHLRQLHAFGRVRPTHIPQPTCIFKPARLFRPAHLFEPTRPIQPMHFQYVAGQEYYSTGEIESDNASNNASDNASGNVFENTSRGASENASEMRDLVTRVTHLEEIILNAGWDRSLEKGLQPINELIRDTRALMRWLLGSVVMGVALGVIFYDRHIEENFAKKQDEMEKRLTTAIEKAIGQLKLELKVESQERLLSVRDQGTGNGH